MKKYTANYARTDPHFVIQNLSTDHINTDGIAILYVLKNILQRGCPTLMSKFLQKKLGVLHEQENFNEPFFFISEQSPLWYDTIKGDKKNDNFPAKDFFYKIIPNEFEAYAFVQALFIPEISINEIIGEDQEQNDRERFMHQQVDFYLPQAKLVIEIDGQQHKLDAPRVSDHTRDSYLQKNGITTIRIHTTELQNGTYKKKIAHIIGHLAQYDQQLNYYKTTYQNIKDNRISETDIATKLLPTAIIRFQILLIELLIHTHLSLTDEQWEFNIFAHEEIGNFAELATQDLLIWINKLHKLQHKTPIKKPALQIKIVHDENKFTPKKYAINIDFSLYKRYTDEATTKPKTIFVRTDYFNHLKERNYFRVSTTEPINYHITDEDTKTLTFFLENIFDKHSFREGQFSIIANALNLRDTIGLLPTGGGKSLCYQLPCLLQPSVNFVVCPIKALMYDQQDNLKKILISNVHFITSDLKPEQRREAELHFQQGRYLFVWISPEKFQIPSFRNNISALIANFSIAYAVVDEVHCLSEWGHDFRTSYLNLAKTIDRLSPKDEAEEGKIKFIGLTATASVNVLKDIKIEFSRQKKHLEDENIKSLLDYSRKELQFEVIDDKGNKIQKLGELLEVLKREDNFLNDADKACIIFTPHVKGEYGCKELSDTLNGIYAGKVSWFSGSAPYGMFEEELKTHKLRAQKGFKDNTYLILVATKAFGMGIDKQNIYYTFHYGLPSSVEALYQEAGRAGRWDKRKKENKDKIGKCYVLHSHETCDTKMVEQLFHQNTTFETLKETTDKVGFDGQDIFRQIFLFIQNQNDVDQDFKIIIQLINHYFKEKKEVKIFWGDAKTKLKINETILQKAIYRLSLLGIVRDWTTDFINHYEVEFNTLDEAHILHTLSDYITKYEPDTDVKREVDKIDKPNILEKAIWYLLHWIFEHIAYNRKQSLKTLSDWCMEFKDSSSFKQKIDSYFSFTDTTFVLQHIAENPHDYEKYFDVLKTNTGVWRGKSSFEQLKYSISRFLESYRNSTGLNFISGFVRLVLNEYEDSDGRGRLESALENIKSTFSTTAQQAFLNHLKSAGEFLTERQKELLSKSILQFYPDLLDELADHFNLPYLLNDVYIQKIKILKNLNQKLYDELEKI